MNIKLKRLAALYLDALVIMPICLVFYRLTIWGFNDIKIPNRMYILLIFLWFSVRDFTFSYRSVGKKILNLSIYDGLGNEVHDWKKILFCGFCSTIIAPISIFTVLCCNQTIVEIFLNIYVLPSNSSRKVVETRYRINSFIKRIAMIAPLVFIIVTFLFLQKLNFYSVRIIFSILIVSLLWIAFNYLIKRRIFKFGLIIIVTFLTLITSYCIFPEKYVFKSMDLYETFYYSYPNRTIYYKMEFNNFAYIFYENSVVYYEKENEYWNIINPLKYKNNHQTLFRKIFFEDSRMLEIKYTIDYLYVEQQNQTAIIVTVKDINEKAVKDSLNTDFEIIDAIDEKKYLAVIDGGLNESYSIEIGAQIYYLNK